MPYLLELVQHELGYNGYGKDVVPKEMTGQDREKCWWNALTREWRRNPDRSLGRLYEIITAWQSLPLLFVRGAGELETKKKPAQKKAQKKSQPKLRKRKRFGDEDDDDEPFIPKGARKTAKYVWNSETRRYDRIPPPIY